MNNGTNTNMEEGIFDDFEEKQIIWEVFGELLDFYAHQPFSAKQVTYEIGIDKKTVNKVFHRLVQRQAITCTGTDHWGVKIYRLNEVFIAE